MCGTSLCSNRRRKLHLPSRSLGSTLKPVGSSHCSAPPPRSYPLHGVISSPLTSLLSHLPAATLARPRLTYQFPEFFRMCKSDDMAVMCNTIQVWLLPLSDFFRAPPAHCCCPVGPADLAVPQACRSLPRLWTPALCCLHSLEPLGGP